MAIGRNDRARREWPLVCPHCGNKHFVRVCADGIVRVFFSEVLNGMQETLVSKAAWRGYACTRCERLISVGDLVEEGVYLKAEYQKWGD